MDKWDVWIICGLFYFALWGLTKQLDRVINLLTEVRNILLQIDRKAGDG